MKSGRRHHGSVPVDNQIYDRLADTWWDPEGMLQVIRTGLNPVRFGYAQRVLTREHGTCARPIRTLDIGCGGGLLSEEFARIGCHVTGIDPSAASVRVADEHARATGLAIEYLVARGEAIPFPDATFDLVYCCDVLEHVADLQQVIAETARVVKPGGIYIYDTINRTRVSRFVVITLLERWTKLAPAGLHEAHRFIRPTELHALMAAHGLSHMETVGIVPGIGAIAAARVLWELKRGRLSYPEAGHRFRLKQGRIQLVSYMGYGVKISEAHHNTSIRRLSTC